MNCALWSAEVFEEEDGSLKNVHVAVIRGKQLVGRMCDCRAFTLALSLLDHCKSKGACLYCNFSYGDHRSVFIEKKKVSSERICEKKSLGSMLLFYFINASNTKKESALCGIGSS